MAMPATGSLSLFSAGKEVVIGAREAPIPDSTVLQNFPNGISLTEISTGTGAASDDPINWRSSVLADARPDEIAPHALSEFYAYDDDFIYTLNISNPNFPEGGYQSFGAPSKTSISVDTVNGRISRGFTGTTNTDNIDPIAVSGYKWREFKFKVRNTTGYSLQYRPLIIFWSDGTDYRRDFAVHSIRMGSTHYYATNQTMRGFNGTTENALPTSESSFYNVALGSTAQKWNIESGGGTPSSNTGPDTGVIYSSTTGNYETTTGRYWYFEASSGTQSQYNVLKPSSVKTLANGATETVSFIYSAWSDNLASWGFSYFNFSVQVTQISN